MKLARPGFGPAAELPAFPPAHGVTAVASSPLGSTNVIGGNRRAALASARGTGRAAYTKAVRPTNLQPRAGTLSMKLAQHAPSARMSRRIGIRNPEADRSNGGAPLRRIENASLGVRKLLRLATSCHSRATTPDDRCRIAVIDLAVGESEHVVSFAQHEVS